MKPLVLVLGLLAGVFVALGLFLGFRPVTDDAGNKCGTAFRANQHLLSGTGHCDKERSDALPLAVVMLGLGIAAGASAVVIRRSEPGVHAAGQPTS